jgi:hypothetical protein
MYLQVLLQLSKFDALYNEFGFVSSYTCMLTAYRPEHHFCGTLYSAERRCKRQDRVSHCHRTSSNQCDPAALFCSLALFFLFTPTRDSVGQRDALLQKATMQELPYAQIRVETHTKWDWGDITSAPTVA